MSVTCPHGLEFFKKCKLFEKKNRFDPFFYYIDTTTIWILLYNTLYTVAEETIAQNALIIKSNNAVSKCLAFFVLLSIGVLQCEIIFKKSEIYLPKTIKVRLYNIVFVYNPKIK